MLTQDSGGEKTSLGDILDSHSHPQGYKSAPSVTITYLLFCQNLNVSSLPIDYLDSFVNAISPSYSSWPLGCSYSMPPARSVFNHTCVLIFIPSSLGWFSISQSWNFLYFLNHSPFNGLSSLLECSPRSEFTFDEVHNVRLHR